ncbi:MAG TPA: flagellar biosynthesis anti-sigma factor FlgM [Candidatus Deferrimicrobiaceae bacterium]|nr:flagellar biosynthesis anti-sigma factor FlgM [Candidatus Deferrimicrobiaceae bacterium]
MKSPGSDGKRGDGPGPAGKKSPREKRVDLLKGKVEKGIFRVKPKKVADKMVEDAVRTIRSRRGSR